MLEAEVTITIPFHDLDPMGVVWHGNYARYLEIARCALLDRIDYNYPRMGEEGYAWPVVEMRLKYVAPLRFAQKAKVTAQLIAWENGLKINYLVHDAATGTLTTRAHTFQVPVRLDTGELCLESPPELVRRVEAVL